MRKNRTDQRNRQQTVFHLKAPVRGRQWRQFVSDYLDPTVRILNTYLDLSQSEVYSPETLAEPWIARSPF